MCERCAHLEEELAQMKRLMGVISDETIIARLKAAFDLTPHGAKLLAALYRAKGRVLSHDFLDEVATRQWRSNFDKGLHVQICRVRKRVGPLAIENHPGLGYSLTAIGALAVEEALEMRGRAAA